VTETEKPDETIADDAPGAEEPGETPGDDGPEEAPEPAAEPEAEA
jgi:hypothetical protein